LGLGLCHLSPCENKCLQIARVDSNGVKDPRVGELAICAELVHGVSAYAKDGRNFFDGQQRLEAGHRAPARIMQH